MKPEITQALQKWFFRSKVYANALHVAKSTDDHQQVHKLGEWLDDASKEVEKALDFLNAEQQKRFNHLGVQFVSAQAQYIGAYRGNVKHKSSRRKKHLDCTTLNYENTKFNLEAFLTSVTQ